MEKEPRRTSTALLFPEDLSSRCEQNGTLVWVPSSALTGDPAGVRPWANLYFNPLNNGARQEHSSLVENMVRLRHRDISKLCKARHPISTEVGAPLAKGPRESGWSYVCM